jgi:oligoribonuclease
MTKSIGYEESALVWLDLETTGLCPYDGVVLEVGVVVTDLELNEVARKSWILQYDRDDILPMMDDYVLDMHLSSGLLKRVWGEARIEEGPVSFHTRLNNRNNKTWESIYNFIACKTGKPENTFLAGSSIHFDRTWLAAENWPAKILKLVSHRMVDVSTFKVAFPGLLTQREGGPAHRALDDLDYSIDQLAQMREKLDLDIIGLFDKHKDVLEGLS